MNKTVNEIIYRSIFITYILDVLFGWSLDNQ